jgi:hypothetical protein
VMRLWDWESKNSPAIKTLERWLSGLKRRIANPLYA